VAEKADQMADAQVLLPSGWKRPRGWSHGIARDGQVSVAGQFGWDPAEQAFPATDFGGQWQRALQNVLAVVAAAGGDATSVTSLRIYVTDLDAYRQAGGAVADGWRATFGAHFPAITMVRVAELTEAAALVEVEASATL
jgi:enamine deaminase RidA (YjgF/YER057c/UK114 family)